MKLNYRVLFMVYLSCLVVIAGADNVPGYIVTPASGDSMVKTAYGLCVHSAYYTAADGLAECGEASVEEVAEAEVATQPVTTQPIAPQNQRMPQVLQKVQSVEFNDSALSLFVFNSSNLTNQGQKLLANLVAKAKRNGVFSKVDEVVIEGHTDKIGGDDYNQRLSADRATAVKDFLISKGVASNRITTMGMGEQYAQVSDKCFKKYANASLAEINRITREEEAGESQDRRHMDLELSKFAKQYKELVACTGPDRRVKVTVIWQQTKKVK